MASPQWYLAVLLCISAALVADSLRFNIPELQSVEFHTTASLRIRPEAAAKINPECAALTKQWREVGMAIGLAFQFFHTVLIWTLTRNRALLHCREWKHSLSVCLQSTLQHCIFLISGTMCLAYCGGFSSFSNVSFRTLVALGGILFLTSCLPEHISANKVIVHFMVFHCAVGV